MVIVLALDDVTDIVVGSKAFSSAKLTCIEILLAVKLGAACYLAP
jgi:hypothetical protein